MKVWIRVSISLLLLILVLYHLDLQQTLSLVRDLRIEWVVVTLLVLTAGVFWSTWKWKLLIQCHGIDFSYLRLVRFYFIGSLSNHFLLSGIGGDAIRIALFGKDSGKIREGVSSVFVERLTGLIALVVIASISVLLLPVPEELRFLPPLYIAILGVVMLGLIWLSFIKSDSGKSPDSTSLIGRIRIEVGKWGNQLKLYRKCKGTCLIALLMSLIFQLQVIATAYLVSRSLEIDLSWAICFLCIPLATLATMLPLSVGGIGIRESAYVLLITQFGVLEEQAFLVGFGTSLFVLFVSLVGGLISLLLERTTSNNEV